MEVEQHRLDNSCFLSIVFVQRARQTAVFSFIGSIPYIYSKFQQRYLFCSNWGASHLAGICGCVHFLTVFRSFYSVLEQILSFNTNPMLYCMPIMQVSQHHFQKRFPNVALPRLSKFCHNVEIHIQNVT